MIAQRRLFIAFKQGNSTIKSARATIKNAAKLLLLHDDPATNEG